MPAKALCKARERSYTYVNCPPEDVSVLSSSYLVCKRLASWLCELQTAGNKDQQHPPCYLPSPLFLPRLFDSHQLATDTHKPWTCPSACQDRGPKQPRSPLSAEGVLYPCSLTRPREDTGIVMYETKTKFSILKKGNHFFK